jgi:putative heme-binding domain-containing protein
MPPRRRPFPPYFRFAAAAAAVFILSAAMAAQQPAAPRGRGAAAPGATVAGGEELFSMTCSVCHGKGGTGSIGPALRGVKFSRDYVASVMRTGRPGTMMSSFVSSFSASEINAIAQYVASLQAPTGPAPDGLRGDPMNGDKIFFANVVYACSHCHTYNSRGGKVGPDLTAKARSLTPRDLFQRIVVVPHRETQPRYTTMRLTTKVGQIIEGIPSGEDKDVLHFYDTSSLPPIYRRIPKKDIKARERRDSPVMPNDYAAKLTLQELLDVVAFLKSAGATPTPVTLSQVVK